MTLRDDLESLWGREEVVRLPVDHPVLAALDEDTRAVLTDVGLPASGAQPYFERVEPGAFDPAGRGGSYVQFGTDGETALVVDTAGGAVLSLCPDAGLPDRYVNSSLRSYVRFLIEMVTHRVRYQGADDETIDAEIPLLERRLRAEDEAAFGGPEHWWAVIFEQMYDGLL